MFKHPTDDKRPEAQLWPALRVRVLHYAGRVYGRDRLNNPQITTREAILIADYVAELEQKLAAANAKLRTVREVATCHSED